MRKVQKFWTNRKTSKGNVVEFQLTDGNRVVGYYFGFSNQGADGVYHLGTDIKRMSAGVYKHNILRAAVLSKHRFRR